MVERKLLVPPKEQCDFINNSCSNDLEWDEEAHEIWMMIMSVVCGHDERYLPNHIDYDFNANLYLFKKKGLTESNGNDTEKLFGYIHDALNMLLYEVTQKEYYELSANISNIMETVEWN